MFKDNDNLQREISDRQQRKLNYAFVMAATRGDRNIVEALLEAGADIHWDNDKALTSAIEKGCMEVVGYLLISGADPHGDDALQVAVKNGHTEIVKMLCGSGSLGERAKERAADRKKWDEKYAERFRGPR